MDETTGAFDAEVLRAVRLALAEDRAADDATTPLLGRSADRPAVARFTTESRCVVAGVPLVAAVHRELDPASCVDALTAEGQWADAGEVIATARGSARMLLGAERVALNFLQRLCGIATATRHAVDAVASTPARITHTRKTTPGLRALERYAVRMGGGVDNRASLADAVMWKDNHWTLLDRHSGTLAQALRAVPPGMAVIVEVETDAQLDEALAAGVGHLLVDNQTPDRLGAWARRVPARTIVQASGGITLENVRQYATAGATLISLGALTHSVRAVPISCAIELS